MKLFKRLSYIFATSPLISVCLLAAPAGATGSWGSPPSAEAFQANNGYLYTNVTGGSAMNTLQGMAAGTGPAIAALTGGGYEVAFQANNGYLYLFNTKTGKTLNTLQGMAAGTSPAIASYAVAVGSYDVAFQANNGHLYTYNWSTGPAATTLAMTPSSNPSIATLSNNSYAIAYSAAGSNNLSIALAVGVIQTDQGVASGTSPSIARVGTQFEIAYIANGSNQLDLYWPNTGPGGTGITVETGTSPSIAAVPSSIYEVALAVPGSDNLEVLAGAGSNTISTDQGLVPGSSPSITVLSDGEYQVAFQAAGSNHLLLYYPALRTGIDTSQGMASTTNPSIQGN